MSMSSKSAELRPVVREQKVGERVTLYISQDTLEGLAAWARADGRTTAEQGRHLIEQAVTARGAGGH